MPISMAMIPLEPKAKLSSSAVKTDLANSWPDLPKPEPLEAQKDQIAFRVGTSDVIIGFMRAPIPWSDLEGPSKTSWLWPNAEAALRSHAGHLIVTVLSEDEVVARARLLTQVCASILATCAEAPGVFWTDAALLIPSKVFQDFTRQILPGAPPIYIWVDFRVGMGETGASGFTVGMTALGHMEFEAENVPETPVGLRERFFGLANYVMERGPVIQDGDTIGEDANERIRVTYADSAFGHAGAVMRLHYGAKPGRELTNGKRVLAEWEANLYYPGTVREQEQGKYHIIFDDGDSAWLGSGQITPLDIKVGSRVFGRYKGGGAYFPGRVTEQKGEKIYIVYDDGDKEWTTISMVRVKK